MFVAGVFLIQRLEGSRFGTPILWGLDCGEGLQVGDEKPCGRRFHVRLRQGVRGQVEGRRAIWCVSTRSAIVLEQVIGSR